MKSFWLTFVFGCLICSQSIADTNPTQAIEISSLYFASVGSLHIVLQSFFYGILATFITCNLIFHFVSRDKDQGYLAIALILLGSHHLFAIDLYPWRAQHHLWITNLLPSLLICSSIGWLSFTQHFYKILIAEQTDFFIRAGSLLAISLIIILPFIPIASATAIATSILLITYGTALNLSVQSWKRHNKSATYIFAAMLCLFTATGLTLSTNLSFSIPSYSIITSIKFLTTLAALLITISLAVRSQQIRLIKNSLTSITQNMIHETGNSFDQQLAKKTEALTHTQDHLIEEIHQSKSSLEDTLQRLKASNQLKDDFLSKISHEFKTPLNGIQGSLQLAKQTVLNEEQKNYVSSALHSSQKLSQLIDDVLDLSQLNAGLLKLKREPFPLNTTITQACNAFQQQAMDKGLQFKLDLSPELPKMVRGDQYRFSQILEKIVSNAVKFTHQGQVRMTADILEPVGDGVTMVIRIDDTGIGIPQEMQEGIFESFRQVERFFSRQYEGTGIGLAVSYYLVRQMGGEISVESTLNQGSSFQITIHLPVVENNKPSSTFALKEIKTQPVLQGKLLVVEDNKVNQMVLVGLLKKIGLFADVAENGKIALQMLATKRYDLILMDCQMPVMNGFEATLAIRQSENTDSRIPIIAVTANAHTTDRTACIEVGMDDFIPKPIKADILSHKLSEWLCQDKLGKKTNPANPTLSTRYSST
ncbi:MAG: response regulator [Pseudomonadales bacterium]|nr:response regulator [Pseudomonadales bacterium]